MATPTYELISSQVLSTSAASVSFTSIPATYRDLVLVVEASVTGGASAFLRFNSNSGSNYNYVLMRGNGSTATSSKANAQTELFIGYNFNKGLYKISIMDYSATDKHKSTISRTDNANQTEAFAGRWAITSAVSSITFTLSGGESWTSGSTFYLYGIAS